MQLDNLSHLAVFAAVARHGSFRKAAAELALSASAVSYAVRTLEDRLGVGLFNRTTRSVALTEAGKHLLERLQPALGGVNLALEEMNMFRASPAGTLRINSSRDAAVMVIGPLIRRYLDAYPDISLDIVSDDGLIDIVERGFDLGIRYEEHVPEDMIAVPVWPAQRFVVVGSPEYFERHGVPRHPDDLARHNCVRYRFPRGNYYKWELGKGDIKLEVGVPGRLSVGDSQLALRAALDGVAITFLPEFRLLPFIASGQLVCVLEDWCPPTTGLMMYYPRQRRMSSALRAFIDMARA
ncbi:LysR family transcriptional regulator [Duganella radicis]|uniref:LysR family transcriptional regulator n=1 Tax=Duganella radicis TaxID=551988 RepID=A0A6L6PGJ8_9BURK|nr:LysR family transcriptional regulator [Duganella radicis]MTV38124.1 LysR family transcriptional regulator [Duganella radicis]